MTDPTPHARRSPMEHERDAGDVSLLDMIARLTEERDALRDAATEARKQLRIIAGMDLIGASATAYNAARALESALAQQEGAKG